jgi:hypothetical protein
MQESKKGKVAQRKDQRFQKTLIKTWKIIGVRKNKLNGII